MLLLPTGTGRKPTAVPLSPTRGGNAGAPRVFKLGGAAFVAAVPHLSRQPVDGMASLPCTTSREYSEDLEGPGANVKTLR